ncbi:MAG: hypothetical protein KDJ47_06025 [Hyphomicrobiaceae bacterium]|nr:hypothetical protein [Hyphomicrobiaceae bacterium]
MQSNTLKSLGRFHKDQQGTVAVMFGLLAIPMVLFVGLAVDYSRALSADRDLQEAVDAATLAAAIYKANEPTSGTNTSSGGTISQDERKTAKQVAIDYLSQNAALRYMKNILTEAQENNNTLQVKVSAEVPATFAKLVFEKFDVKAEAKSRMAGEPIPMCLLGLNPTASEAVKAWGSGEVFATNCAVLSNSTSTTGLVTGGSATMEATAFCSAGGSSGDGFTPKPYTKCDQQDDPYENRFTKSALSTAGYTVPGPCMQTDYVAKQNVTFNAGNSIYTFCGGLDIRSNKTVTLGPGIYLIFGELHINANATLDARQGTTIIFGDSSWMSGQENGYIDMQGNGNLLLTAPTTGLTASMAVIQPSVSGYNGSSTSGNQHTITGGGNIEMVGNWYTPQSKTLITGNGTINGGSAYFSMVSDTVEVDGNGSLTIRAGGDPASVTMTAIPGRMTMGRFITLIE